MRKPSPKRAPAVFLDRDGTLNLEKHFLHRAEDWEWTPGAVKALEGFKRMGFRTVVLSNQSGIARGYFTAAAVRRLHGAVNRALPRSAKIDAFYFCPHHPDHGRPCACRKPKTGLLDRAVRELGLDRRRSYVIGDRAADIDLGRNAGVTALLVRTGYGRREARRIRKGVPVVADLRGALAWIRRGRRPAGTPPVLGALRPRLRSPKARPVLGALRRGRRARGERP